MQTLTKTSCARCGLGLSWHFLTGRKAKTQKAYCIARRVSTQPYAGWRSAKDAWGTNFRAGAIIDRTNENVSPTFTPEDIEALHSALGDFIESPA